MSRIYFHEEGSKGSEVCGSERAWMGWLLNDIFLSAVRLHSSDDTTSSPSTMRHLIKPDHYTLQQNGAGFIESLRIAMTVNMGGDLIQINGRPIDLFSVCLNTGLAVGSDVIKLFARLHGQCELHAYVAGENRTWLAHIIEQGLKIGIMRIDVGWQQTIALLQSHADRPVVTSYSVCQQFPDYTVADWKPQTIADEGGAEYEDFDAWYDLPEATQWALGLAGLDKLLEMQPENWQTYHFGDGMNGFGLRAYADGMGKYARVFKDSALAI